MNICVHILTFGIAQMHTLLPPKQKSASTIRTKNVAIICHKCYLLDFGCSLAYRTQKTAEVRARTLAAVAGVLESVVVGVNPCVVPHISLRNCVVRHVQVGVNDVRDVVDGGGE